jgi:hypothetical protein
MYIIVQLASHTVTAQFIFIAQSGIIFFMFVSFFIGFRKDTKKCVTINARRAIVWLSSLAMNYAPQA